MKKKFMTRMFTEKNLFRACAVAGLITAIGGGIVDAYLGNNWGWSLLCGIWILLAMQRDAEVRELEKKVLDEAEGIKKFVEDSKKTMN